MTRSMRLSLPLMMIAIGAPSARAQHAVQREIAPTNAVAGEATAQSAPVGVGRDAGTPDAVRTGPVAERVTAGIRVSRAALPAAGAPAPLPRREESSRNRAMMIVGAAGLIVGAVIGDTAGTLIMVAGATVGLYGLYKYLE